MALSSVNRWPGPIAPSDTFSLNFVGGYLDQAHVHAYEFDQALQTYTPISISFVGPYTITGATVSAGKELLVRRETPDLPLVDFVQGARLSATNLDTATQQAVLRAAEAVDHGNLSNLNDFSDAVQTVMQQVGDAQQAATDAQGYANAASISAGQASGYASTASGHAFNAGLAESAAQGYANQAGQAKSDAEQAKSDAEQAKTDAETARDQAQTARTQAQTAKTGAEDARDLAQGYASAASGSASAASSSAGSASSSAGSAANSASNALGVYNSMQGLLEGVNLASCRLVCIGGVVQLVPHKGGLIYIGGTLYSIATTMPWVSLPNTSTIYSIVAYVDAGQVKLTYTTSANVYNSTLGLWVTTSGTIGTVVGWARGDWLSVGASGEEGPGCLSAYNSRGYIHSVTAATVTKNWDGATTTLATAEGILGPASIMIARASLNVMTDTADRVGDATLHLVNITTVSRTRNTHEDAYSWRNHSPQWEGLRAIYDTPAWLRVALRYTAITNSTGTYTTLGSPDFVSFSAKTDR